MAGRRKKHTKYPRAVEHRVSSKIALLREEGYNGPQAAAIAYRENGIGYTARRKRAKRDAPHRSSSSKGSHYWLTKSRFGWTAILVTPAGRRVATLRGPDQASRASVAKDAHRRWPGTHEVKAPASRDLRAQAMQRQNAIVARTRRDPDDVLWPSRHRRARARFFPSPYTYAQIRKPHYRKGDVVQGHGGTWTILHVRLPPQYGRNSAPEYWAVNERGVRDTLNEDMNLRLVRRRGPRYAGKTPKRSLPAPTRQRSRSRRS